MDDSGRGSSPDSSNGSVSGTASPPHTKPNLSYVALIAQAILSTPEHRLLLSDIYEHIMNKWPYFRRAIGPGWRNSVRHNLSLNECFVKGERTNNGSGYYWEIHPNCIQSFSAGDYSRRNARRRARRGMINGPTTPTTPPMPAMSPMSMMPLMHTNFHHFNACGCFYCNRLRAASRGWPDQGPHNNTVPQGGPPQQQWNTMFQGTVFQSGPQQRPAIPDRRNVNASASASYPQQGTSRSGANAIAAAAAAAANDRQQRTHDAYRPASSTNTMEGMSRSAACTLASASEPQQGMPATNREPAYPPPDVQFPGQDGQFPDQSGQFPGLGSQFRGQDCWVPGQGRPSDLLGQSSGWLQDCQFAGLNGVQSAHSTNGGQNYRSDTT